MTDSTEILRQIKSQTLERVSELTSSPKPTYSIDGQSVSWTEYLKQLRATVEWCDEMLSAFELNDVTSIGVCK